MRFTFVTSVTFGARERRSPLVGLFLWLDLSGFGKSLWECLWVQFRILGTSARFSTKA